MIDMEKVIKGLECCTKAVKDIEELKDPICTPCPYSKGHKFCCDDLKMDALELLKEQKEIKEQFIEAFNTIRDAYDAPANREKILLNYLARNACCCEQKLLIDSGQFADMPTMQSAT